MTIIHIAPYRPEWQPYFEKFNKAWIEKHFVLEAIDNYVLTHPEEAILKDGGEILFALHNQTVIGAVALKKIDNATMELTKMAVDEAFHGLGAGTKLCKSALEKAKELEVKKLVLYTQSALKPALSIYKKFGFQQIPIEQGIYKRADTKMELNIK